MRHLILKDFKVAGKSYLYVIGLSILFSTVSMISNYGIQTKIMYILAVAILVIFPHMSTIGKDVKYDSDELFNSLAITRNDLVVAKYIFIFISMIISILFIFLYTNSLKLFFASTFQGLPMSYIDALLVLSMLLIFFSLNLFITYLSIKKAQSFNQICYMLIIIIPAITLRLLELTNLGPKLNYLSKLNLDMIFCFTLAFAILLYIISMQFSKIVYSRKDF